VSHYIDSTKAVFPPLSGVGVPGQRNAIRLQSAGGAVVSRKLAHDRIYKIQTSATAIRVTFRGDNTVAAASGVSDSTDFLIPANSTFTFLAFKGETNPETELPRLGSLYVYAIGDADAAFEAFIWQASQ
jgi:hypothetical protein